MIRVGDLDKSIDLLKTLGMTEIRRSVNEQYKYTLAFVGFDADSTVLELTHNWGQDKYALPLCINKTKNVRKC